LKEGVMGRKVAIVGTGQTHHKARQADMNITEMIHVAVKRCLEDAELTMDQIDGVLIGNMEHFEGINLSDMWAVDASGALGRYGMKITTGGSTGTSLSMAAYYHVASGLFDIVMAIGWQKQSEGETTAGLISATDPIWERLGFAGAFGTFGAAATQFMKEYGLTEEHAAKVAVKNRQNGRRNPYAHLKLDITVEDVLKSPMLAYPVRMLDMCPASEGACAIIMACEEKVKKITDRPAWVAAAVTRHDAPFIGDVPMFMDLRTLRSAAKEAYARAGIYNPLKEIDVIELYEPVSWAELSFIDALGICERGEGGKLIDKGITYMDGECPVNPSGGVLCTNPIGATAMLRVAEAAIQIRGQGGERQVPKKVNTAVATGYGGNWWSDLMILKSSL
jgi:acetyl-CoA C-acetyltransferase